MANIDIYDGTATPRAGKQLMYALQDLARIRQKEFHIFPDPRKSNDENTRRYNIVNGFANLNYFENRNGRNQVNVAPMPKQMADAKGLEEIVDVDSLKIIILADDIFCGEESNWCIGVANGVDLYDEQGNLYDDRDFLTVTTYDAKTDVQLKDRFLHELGHIFGAAPKGRSNTEEFLGPHCINDLCVMQQRDTVDGQEELTRQRQIYRAPTYCNQCVADLKSSAKFER